VKQPKIVQKNDINLFEALTRRERSVQTERDSSRMWLLTAAALVVALVGFKTVTMSRQLDQLQGDISSLQSFTQNQQYVQAYQQAMLYQSSTASLRTFNDASKRYLEALRQADRVTSSRFAQVSRELPSGVRAERWSYEDGVISVSCWSTDKDAPAKFAENLTNTKQFQDVGYYGFQSRDNGYEFTVTCGLWNATAGGDQ